MAVEIERFLTSVHALPECASTESQRYTTFRVRGRPFGYLWPDTETVGLKQTLIEQAALVAERPDVFEVQFTAGGFGWVVVHLAGIELDELCELTLEAWYLTAPEDLLTAVPSPESLAQAG
ncbi:MmcQ/YjbR family DNA-binding protein [Nocardiopsis sp. MG754419]|uniref:MmcQ/YjbR family DNA-binding protein n=1 Tax=Nocardiopsis sp. MG754419 TaxID=2259865 RepID=UPI001BA858F2|nr:MmcQ/YjbR family DNA-binding protein [Nocardiopsis sp. MG754419]MBR8743925.1 MmcQ/YjbR family DNA-binding protein [Nocardiopsis sp. MG754419]